MRCPGSGCRRAGSDPYAEGEGSTKGRYNNRFSPGEQIHRGPFRHGYASAQADGRAYAAPHTDIRAHAYPYANARADAYPNACTHADTNAHAHTHAAPHAGTDTNAMD